MRRRLLVLLLASFAAVHPARADTVPTYALDKDFENCVGDPAKAEPARITYCNCIRDTMRSWDAESYTNLALETTKADAQHAPQAIQDVAKACIEKALH